MDEAIYKLTNQLIDCQDGRSKLHDEIERLRDDNKRLREQIAKLERQHKIAHANGYEEGYKAGRRDVARSKQR